MRKKFLTVVAAAIMTMSMTISAFADTESGLLAHYGFDENTKNSVDDKEATQVGKGANGKVNPTPAGTVFTYADGVNGKALEMKDDNNDGFNLNVKPTGDAYTFSLWVKADSCAHFAEPIMWYGSADQSTQAWVGIWPGLAETWSMGGPVGGSCEGETRVGVNPAQGNSIVDEAQEAFDWTMVTLTVENGKAKLYYDGVLVGMTAEADKMPSVKADDRTVYLGANAWDIPFAGLVDELYVYDRVLSADDVKELYTSSNANKKAAHNLEGYKEPATLAPPKVQSDASDLIDSSSSKDEKKDDEKDNTMIIVVVVIVVVVVVAVVAAVAVSSKKKKGGQA